MSPLKPLLVALVAMLLAFPAMAGGCYSKKIRGGGDDGWMANAVRITVKNKTNAGIATYLTDPDGTEERIWVDESEKITRKFDFNNEFKTYRFKLDYSPSASRTDLLDFNVRNDANYHDPGIPTYKSVYTPSGTEPNNITCHRTWRTGDHSWDIEITFT